MTEQEKILRLKEEKNAVILAHYYAPSEVQDVADYIGDSYQLSKIAVDLKENIVVFAGVSFMGESAKLLNSGKKILMPDMHADCPMAHMVVKETVEKARKEYDDLAVVCYINSTAEIKSWSDVCVTSANAVKIVKNLPNKNILFIPDKNLARYVSEQVPQKNFIFNNGYCPIHENMKADEIKELKEIHKDAPVLVHPECNSEVLSMADYVGSTSGIIDYVKANEADEYIIGTEEGVKHALKLARQGSKYYFPKTTPICKDMKLNTLANIIKVLENEENDVAAISGEVGAKATNALENMIKYAQ